MPPIRSYKRGEKPGDETDEAKAAKVRHVLREARKGSGDHHCHYPGCGKPCPPAMWGCRSCWFKLPKYLRDKIWATYRIGQEISKTPSRKYLEVANEVQEWVNNNAARK